MSTLPTQQTPPRDDEGFSLIELMVALVVTGIITGAMFGLLTGGQNAFRREPELADRQQAIRISMDRIQRDIQAAGGSMGPFSQIFTDLFDDAGVVGPNAPANTDILEFLAHSGECPDIVLNPTTPVVGTQLSAVGDVPACFPEEAPLFILYDNGVTKPGWGDEFHGGMNLIQFQMGQQGAFPASQVLQGMADLDCGDPLSVNSQGMMSCSAAGQGALPIRILQLDMVRYQIAPDTDNMPSLWRSGFGAFDSAAVVAPTAATAAAAGWRLIARGIEDMQIQYFTTNGGWTDDAGAVAFATLDYGTIVQRVKIALQARTTATNLEGATTSVAGVDAVRGQLTTVMVPRAALFNMTQAQPNPLWH